MSVILSLLSSFLLVIVMGGVLPKNYVTAEITKISNSATVRAYWQTKLPNTPMPSAILERLTSPAGNEDHGEKDNSRIQIAEKGIEEKYVEASILKARKIGLHSTKEANTKMEKSPENGPVKERNNKKVLHLKGSSTETDDQTTANFRFGPATNDQKSAYFRWGPATNDQRSAYFRWGPATNDQRSAYFRWGAPATNEQRSAYFRWGHESMENVQGQEGRHGHGGEKHMHDEFMINNTIFLEEALAPGSAVTTYIRPSAIPGGAPLLRRDVADSIPMSTENFTDIMAMFAPASHGMARHIWSTLDICEHLRPVKGEKKTCVTSVESMVEFAASVIAMGDTRDLRALSSPDVPVEGVTPGRNYKVAAARRLAEAGDTVTCHNMKFPVAAYMCHAVNPTRVYTVTLESELVIGAGQAGQRMEALAVCHLDTSEFGAMTMPEHVKPGDAPVCHFISRDSVLWTRAAPAAAA